MINVIIPINGLGTRFAEENYSLPKPLIFVLGKRMINWVIDSLKLSKDDNLIIPYNSSLDFHNFRDIITQTHRNLNITFIPIDRPTKGAAETISVAIKDTSYEVFNLPTLIVDCDTFYETDIVNHFKQNPGNLIYCFQDKEDKPIYSYVKLVNDVVTNIKEKQKISDHACTGAYGFDSMYTLQYYTNNLLETNMTTNGEYYISAIYELMIKNEETIFSSLVENFHCVGTPLQLKIFCETYNQGKQRFCFDLDGTLVTSPVVPNDYSTVEPIEKNINLLKFLKQKGHHIIIYTARRMRTHRGNIGAIVADVGEITINTLKRFGIPYDELCFGKPWAQFYIDDLAVDCNQDIQKAIGYYNTSIKPRDFNTLDINSNVIRKTGKISGEAYYYDKIKDYDFSYLFPKMFKSTPEYIEIEKIDGVTLSYLLTNNSLDTSTFEKMLLSLYLLHSVNSNDNYDGFLYFQFEERFKSYDYSKFGDGSIIDEALSFISKYYMTGYYTIIHGDPVFSNILVNKQNDIKFIDMRGKFGYLDTICGDLRYDLAKIYQSLMGYDFIINDKRIVRNNILLSSFEDFVTNYYRLDIMQIKKLTGCLYLSLIPLHDNSKCQIYFDIGTKLLRGEL